MKIFHQLYDASLTNEVKQIKAQTTTNNIASQKILEKHGFKKINTRSEPFIMNGEEVSFVYYALDIEAAMNYDLK